MSLTVFIFAGAFAGALCWSVYWRIPTPAEPQTGAPLHLIFKEAPILTTERKTRITSEWGRFYSYLVGMGFTPPVEVPPVGVKPGKAGASRGYVRPGTIYDEEISIGENSLDDPSVLASVYGSYAFSEMFKAGRPGDEFMLRTRSELLFEDYFVTCFKGSRSEAIGTDWASVLWDMRAKFGPDFMDRTRVFTYKRFEPIEAEEVDFDAFFAKRLLRGAWIVDNNAEHRPEMEKILQDAGLYKPRDGAMQQ